MVLEVPSVSVVANHAILSGGEHDDTHDLDSVETQQS
jgi:hypothetical protein